MYFDSGGDIGMSVFVIFQCIKCINSDGQFLCRVPGMKYLLYNQLLFKSPTWDSREQLVQTTSTTWLQMKYEPWKIGRDGCC